MSSVVDLADWSYMLEGEGENQVLPGHQCYIEEDSDYDSLEAHEIGDLFVCALRSEEGESIGLAYADLHKRENIENFVEEAMKELSVGFNQAVLVTGSKNEEDEFQDTFEDLYKAFDEVVAARGSDISALGVDREGFYLPQGPIQESLEPREFYQEISPTPQR